jgi:hypothetical protein
VFGNVVRIDLPTTSKSITGIFLPGRSRADGNYLWPEPNVKQGRSQNAKLGTKWNKSQQKYVTSKARDDGRVIGLTCRFGLSR